MADAEQPIPDPENLCMFYALLEQVCYELANAFRHLYPRHTAQGLGEYHQHTCANLLGRLLSFAVSYQVEKNCMINYYVVPTPEEFHTLIPQQCLLFLPKGITTVSTLLTDESYF